MAKQQEEKYEAKMKLLNDRVRHDLPLTKVEWAAWRQWMGLVPSSSSSARRRKRKKRRKKKLPRGRARRRQRQRPLSCALIVDSGRGMCRAGFPSSCCVPFGCRQAQMLGIMAGMDQKDFAVHVVRELGGAPGPVHRQSGGHSCFMGMDLADPVSSGKYSGIFVFTAPVAEPTVVSFTVPLNGCTIVATATVVTSCCSSTGCPGSAAPMFCGGVCVAMSCGGGGFTPDGVYDSVWDSVRPMTENTFIISSTKKTLGVLAC